MFHKHCDHVTLAVLRVQACPSVQTSQLCSGLDERAQRCQQRAAHIAEKPASCPQQSDGSKPMLPSTKQKSQPSSNKPAEKSCLDRNLQRPMTNSLHAKSGPASARLSSASKSKRAGVSKGNMDGKLLQSPQQHDMHSQGQHRQTESLQMAAMSPGRNAVGKPGTAPSIKGDQLQHAKDL